MNEILLYSPITAEAAMSFIYNLSWMADSTIYSVRMYTPGGDVQAAWGMWAKMQEVKAKGCRSIAKVDGMAASMGGFLLCAFDEREALETSQIMIHRAILTIETDDKGKIIPPSKDEENLVASINNDLKAKLLQIIDDKKLQKIKGYGVTELFDEKKERINCFLTPQEALEIGLITKIIPVNSANAENIAKAVTACYTTATAAKADNNNSDKMTKDEFEEKNPDEAKALKEEAVKAYKAAQKKAAKAKADMEDPDEDGDDDEGGEDPDEDGDESAKAKKAKAKKAKAQAELISQGVVLALQKMGIQQIEGNANFQTAESSAKQVKLEAEKKTAQEKELEDMKKTIEAIKAGKPIVS